MSDTGGDTSGLVYWGSIIFSGIGSGVLGHFARDWRKKDPGEFASDLLEQCREDIKQLKNDNERCKLETAELKQISTRNDIVIRIAIPALVRLAPASQELQTVRDILGTAFPVAPGTPADMLAKLSELGGDR